MSSQEWSRREFTSNGVTEQRIDLDAGNYVYVYVAPIGRPRLRFRITVWLRRLDRRDPWRKWRTMGLLDDTSEAPMTED